MSAWHRGTRDDMELREKGHDVDVSLEEPHHERPAFADREEVGSIGDRLVDEGPRRSKWPDEALTVAETYMTSLDLSDAPLDHRFLMPYLVRKFRAAAGSSRADPTNAERQARHRARLRGDIAPSVTRRVINRRGSFQRAERR